MRKFRLFLGLCVAVALAPGTFVRTPKPPRDVTSPVVVSPLPIPEGGTAGIFAIDGLWELSSGNDRFGGYSALTFLPDGRLIAGSDAGNIVVFTPPEPGASALIEAEQIGQFAPGPEQDKRDVDLEALTRDPDTGTIWAAYEQTNTIERYGPDLKRTGRIVPEALSDWNFNSGPETLLRLPDGRFLAIAEGGSGWLFGLLGDVTAHRAAVFAGDPLKEPETRETVFRSPPEYRPVDAAMLTEDHVLILLRDFVPALPPRFRSALLVASLDKINRSGEWSGAVLARIEPPLPSENFEGLATRRDADGSVIVWLIADDNFSANQRTLLYKLRLSARQLPK